MTYKKILTGLAAFGMVAAPVAANAGVRAGDAGINLAPIAQTVTTDGARASANVDKENNLSGPGVIIALIAGIIVVVTIIVATKSGNDVSPGA